MPRGWACCSVSSPFPAGCRATARRKLRARSTRATSWHCNKFINPARDGAVLPVLQLNQYKIANPTLLARIPQEQLLNLLRGYGYEPHLVTGDDPAAVHQAMAGALEACADRIAEIQHRARADDDPPPQAWPVIVLCTPKGWTCPPVVDGQQGEGRFTANKGRLLAGGKT